MRIMDQMKSNYKKSLFMVISICITVVFLYSCTVAPLPDAEIKVDVSQIRHTMRGGMGASWHAISKEMHELPGYNKEYKYSLIYPQSRGSAFGGNPPASDISAWNQIKQYAFHQISREYTYEQEIEIPAKSCNWYILK